MTRIAIVIPCFQNSNELNDTVAGIAATLRTANCAAHTWELWLVDDASRDDTWNVICGLRPDGLPVHGLRLEKNVGSYSAITAAFDRATCDAFLVMAADGDDPPATIAALVEAFESDADLVQAHRSSSDKHLLAKLFGKAYRQSLRLFRARNIPEGGSDLTLFERSLIEKCKHEGWTSGNTLIQVFQHAERTVRVPYRKGHGTPTSWSLGKRILLWLHSLRWFVPIPFIRKFAREPKVEETHSRC